MGGLYRMTPKKTGKASKAPEKLEIKESATVRRVEEKAQPIPEVKELKVSFSGVEGQVVAKKTGANGVLEGVAVLVPIEYAYEKIQAGKLKLFTLSPDGSRKEVKAVKYKETERPYLTTSPDWTERNNVESQKEIP